MTPEYTLHIETKTVEVDMRSKHCTEIVIEDVLCTLTEEYVEVRVEVDFEILNEKGSYYEPSYLEVYNWNFSSDILVVDFFDKTETFSIEDFNKRFNCLNSKDLVDCCEDAVNNLDLYDFL